jgi:hypothetical protein
MKNHRISAAEILGGFTNTVEIVLTIGVGGAVRSEGVILQHDDVRLQTIGMAALDRVSKACGALAITDASDLIGLDLQEEDWTLFCKASEEQRALLFPKPPPMAQESPSSNFGKFIYVISATDSERPLCKIGIASSPEKRLQQLSTSSPHALRLELAMYSAQANAVEKAAHSHFYRDRRNGEWFAITARQAISYLTSDARTAA